MYISTNARYYNSMPLEECLSAVDAPVGLPSGTLNGSENLEDLEEWNSMALIAFIAMADSQGYVKLTPRQIGPCATVAELMSLVKVEGAAG